jgi:hypothetical protein
MFSKKRLLAAAGAITALGAAATLVTGITFGLFSANAGPQTNTFTAGTVTFGAPVSVPCTIGPMEAGDASTGYTPGPGTDAPCTFTVSYTGNLGAFIGLGLQTTPASGGLYNGTATGLQFLITDNNSTAYTTTGAIHTNTTTPLSPLFVHQDTGSTSHTFTVNYGLPLTATNQGLSTTLTLTVYAVQASNNGSSSSCTAGIQCATITAWS